MSQSQRQEVFNVMLAQLLQERGAIVAPESITYIGTERRRQMPDVLVSYQGLRTAIEGEVEAPNARDKAIASAMHRVETGVAHIGVGIVYPQALRGIPFAKLKSALATANLEIAVTTEAGRTGFTTGNVNYLERILRSTYEQLIREDVVAESVALLDAAVDRFAAAVLPYRGIWGRITEAIGAASSAKELDALTEAQRGANCRIGGLVLINALIFHDILSSHYPRVTPLADLIAQDRLPTIAGEWNYILTEIDYYPIFHLAREIWLSISFGAWGVQEAISLMSTTARQISERRAALRHDLMGRVYHRLLSEAKYLGTYYTSIPAATLLLKLALRQSRPSIQWDDLEQIDAFRIADLACGTGTLLMAAADSVLDNYVRAVAENGGSVELTTLHKALAESILHGYDVLPSAIHLTASTLALRSPDVPVTKMNLFSLPLGGPENKLGSIEFLRGRSAQIPMDLFGALPKTQQVTGQSMDDLARAPVPELDLCVMNPPFVRSVIGNLLFGSLPTEERKATQKELQDLVRQPHVRANITAGLGSVFVAVADMYLKPGGVLALVLPKAVLSGVSWKETRNLINERYVLEYIIASQDPEHWNFSESTDLSEVMLVARKREDSEQSDSRSDETVTAVNLWRNPQTSLEALAIATELKSKQAPEIEAGQGALDLKIGSEKFGEAVSSPWSAVQRDWMLPATFAQSDLIRAGYHLQQGDVWLPGYGTVGTIDLLTLNNFVSIGPDGRDIHDGFDVVETTTAYPAVWGHKSEEITCLAQQPNRYLQPLAEAKDGRPLRKLEDLWPKASRLLIGARIWLKTHNVLAVRVSKPVLSNVWWTLTLKSEFSHPEVEKALTLWLDSTLSVFLLLLSRQETRGAWIQFKKPILQALPVLNLSTISEDQLAMLASAYDRVSELPLRPLPEMALDEVRGEIDAVIADALGLPDLTPLRTMLAREPIICLQRIH